MPEPKHPRLTTGRWCTAAAVVLAAAYGCSTYGGEEAAGPPVVPSSDAATVEGAAPDAEPIGEIDAAPRRDGGEEAVVDASACATRPMCDCDGDGYLRADCPDDAGVDAQSPRGDCDDLDPVRHPDAGFRADVPPSGASPPGDWNCNGEVERLPEVQLRCPDPTPPPVGVGSFTCNGGKQGFPGSPACGTAAIVFACPTGTASTAEGCRTPRPTNITTVQQCR